jgi:hypothetical protein
MATSSRVLTVLAFLATYTIAYYDAGDATIPTTTAYVPPVTQHHLLPTDYELWTKPRPSMITAVAPSLAMLGEGFALEYSIHFNNQAPPRYQQQQGILKRGVFASDPPLSTCQQCDPDGRPILTPTTNINGTGFTSTPCSTIPYTVRLDGVFRHGSRLTVDRASSAHHPQLRASASIQPTPECSRHPRQLLFPFHAVALLRFRPPVYPTRPSPHPSPSAADSSPAAQRSSAISR